MPNLADFPNALTVVGPDPGQVFINGDSLAPAVKLVAALDAGEQPIPLGDAFTEIGLGTVGNPSAVVPNLALVKGSIVGAIRTSGPGAELRLVEVHDDGSRLSMNTVPFAVPDTGGAYKSFQFLTDVPPTAGRHQYVLEGHAGALAVALIRWTQVALLKMP